MSAMDSTIDIVLRIKKGSTKYSNDSLSVARSSKVRSLESAVRTTVSLSWFPEVAADPVTLYNILQDRLQSAIDNGNFTKIFNSQLLLRTSHSTPCLLNSSAVVSGVTFSTLKFSVPAPLTFIPTSLPTRAPATVFTMSTAELSVIVIGAFLGVVVVGLVLFACSRYLTLMYTRYHQKRFLREGLEIAFSSDDILKKDDLDLDKLEYIADVIQ